MLLNWKGNAMKTIAKILLLVTTLFLGSLTLTACNTMQGAGRDVERAGQKLQDEAVEHKRY